MSFHTRSLLKISVLFVGMLFHQAYAASGLPDFTGMVEKYGPAVVNISSQNNPALSRNGSNPHQFRIPDLEDGHPLNELLQRFFDDQFEMPDLGQPEAKSLGSGFIISSDGYIMTNHHVVKGADEILVKLTDRREFKAELIGSDKGSDIALIKIDADNLPTVNLGKSSQIKVGEWVLAIGSPFGFEHSVTAGIVSAKGRSLPNENYVPFIQTDVAINPGNSGGPLFNLKGEVIGVNSQIYSRSGGFMGLSFSIPIELAMNVADQLKDHGQVTRGYLGVLIQDVTRDLADSFNMNRPHGALIAKVLPGGPADKAGLEVGDVILSFNGQEISKSSQLPPMVGTSPIDKPARLEVLRDGKRKIIEVEVQQLQQAELSAKMKPLAKAEDRAGLIVQNLGDAQRIELGIEGKNGVLVTEVKAGAGRLAGIQAGDVILMINNQKIRSVEEYEKALQAAKAGKNLAVLVQREEGALFIPLRLPLN